MEKDINELWVIEAPGKVKTIKNILTDLQINSCVMATKGHFISMPDKLDPIGVDSVYNEYERKPKDIKQIKRLRELAIRSKLIVVATDADQEGDVIAWDIYTMVEDIQNNVIRVRLKGMDQDSVLEAIRESKPVKKEDAIPGRTRSLIDRLIGATLSGNGIAVGRVGTSLLGLIQERKPTTQYLNLIAMDKKGGHPWKAVTPIISPLTQQIAKSLSELIFPSLSKETQSQVIFKPSHMGDIMVRASERLGMSPGETAKAMQKSYEAGKLSYPRSGSNGVSIVVAQKIKKILEKNRSGYKFDDTMVQKKDEDEVHDSPYPIGDVNYSYDPEKQSADEGIRTLISQDLIKTGQKHIRQIPNTKVIEEFLIKKGFGIKVATFISNLNWYKDEGPRFPGQQNWGNSEIVTRPADAVLLEEAMKAGLGKPSTWGNHIDGFMKRGLVDENLELTEKGKEWVLKSPKALLNFKVSASIEKACEYKINKIEEGKEPWEILASEIIKRLPVEISKPIMDEIQKNGIQPKIDFRKEADELEINNDVTDENIVKIDIN